MPKYIVYLMNGGVLTSDKDLVECVYNNPDIGALEVNVNGVRAKVKLNPGCRLIHFRKIEKGSPEKITYCIGFQKTIRGRNFKTILEIRPNGELVLHDGCDGRRR